MNNCKEDSIWCNIAELRGKLNCQWLSGRRCHCRDCDGTNILDIVRILTRLFIAMRTDKLIRQIEEDVLKMSGKLDRAVGRVVKKYRKDIIVKLKDAKKIINASNGNIIQFL